MTFAQLRDLQPNLLCVCGHPAHKHLYCGDHFCIASRCACSSFAMTHLNEQATLAFESVTLAPVPFEEGVADRPRPWRWWNRQPTSTQS